MNASSRTFSRFASQRSHLCLALLALLFCTAPTPGDIGGCGQKPQELDPGVFFASKEAIDCQRCGECGIESKACRDACQSPDTYPTTFPERCLPLVHDGEVCLRKLQYASCGDYASYMSDVSPSVPTECNFCPEPAP
jgi:hypothetical protein